MSAWSYSVSDAIQRLSRRDPTLKVISFRGSHHTDAELAELADCLLAHPDVVTYVDLGGNRLTDDTGVKLARYLAASSTIQWLDLSKNQISSATYLAVAAALRVNSSLRVLYLHKNQAVDRTRIDAAFAEALRLNLHRSARSQWLFYSSMDDFKRLKHAAKQLGHPSLQLLLAAKLLPDDRPTAIDSPTL